MITQRPIRVKPFTEILSEVKYQALDLPLQRHLKHSGDNNDMGSLPERIDDHMATTLEVEFNDLYNILRSPQSLRDHHFLPRFALVTPDQ